MSGEVGADQRLHIVEGFDVLGGRVCPHDRGLLLARQHRPGTPAPMGVERQQALAEHRAYIQRLVEQGVDVHVAVAVTEHLQGVLHVLQLFADDRLEQGVECRTGNHFP